jgi:anti-anti-sigma factor
MQDTIRFEDGPDAATRSLVPSGDLDAATADEVRLVVEQALGAGKRLVIVDLSQTSFVDSAALAALLDGNARMRRFGASMVIVVPADSRVRKLLNITRLDKVLRVVESRQEALTAEPDQRSRLHVASA